jgi:hypothetical protein
MLHHRKNELSEESMTRNPEPSLPGNAIEPITRPNNRLARATILIVFVCLCFFAARSWGQSGSLQGSTATGSTSTDNLANIHSKSGGGEPVPLGVAPPPGQSWHVQANDNFDQDDSINQSLWNGGTGGGMPPGFCGTLATSCGYTGDDCKNFFGSYPNPPFETIDRGVGLAIQPTHAAPGDLKYSDNKMADIQSYGKITIHPGSFVEWQARMPTDRQGEGDGWHVDLWCTTLSRNKCEDSSEVDVAEKILGTGNSSKTSYIIHEPSSPKKTEPKPGFDVGQTIIEAGYGAPGSPDLSAGFHTYGLAWRDDHQGKQGSLEAYIDGKPIANHPVPINDPSWGSGAYCYAGWMQQELGSIWGGGAPIDSRTSQKNPLYIKRFTVWKAY